MTQTHKQETLRVVIVGHVDHGKSTLIGRLLYDTGSLPDGKREEIEKISQKRGAKEIEWSFVLDAFQAERDQAVTIDTTQIWFSSKVRDYVIIDAPGHREFLKNMISGAASADAAILVVDAAEGLREQTRRHAYLLQLLGMRQVMVVINKMDSVNYDADRFEEVAKETVQYLNALGITPLHIVPMAARHGEMIVDRHENMGWYQGKTVLESLDRFEIATAPIARSLRFAVQDVYRHDESRILVGRVETGTLRKGDTLLFSPGNEKAIVKTINIWPEDGKKVQAQAGEVVGITLDDKIFVERGHIASHEKNPPMLSNVFRANIFWLGQADLKVGNSYKIRYATHEAMVTIQSVDRVINTENLDFTGDQAHLKRHDVAEITMRARDLLPIDPYTDNFRLGRLVIYDGYDIVGGGTISMEDYADQRRLMKPKADNIYEVSHLMTYQERVKRQGHKGGVFWLTGLSGAGKSTLAMKVEQALFEKEYNSYVLDGDNVRHGLCADLGFSPEDRAENIRRVGEVAALLSGAGMVSVTAFISPYRDDRDRARRAAPESFHEIYVKADLATCEKRDPKGLYKKARDGQISDFTGIGSPYEPPQNPELVVDTQHNDVDECVRQIVDYIEQQMRLPAEKQAANKDKALVV
jgi:bifunctional enzyme CysN/CysC